MKNSKFIKLFSLLLCIVMLFVSCNNGDDPAGNQDDAPVTYALSDFYANTYKPNDVVYSTVTEINFGDHIETYGSVALFLDTTCVDHMGNVDYTYTLYDLEESKVLLTKTVKLAADKFTDGFECDLDFMEDYGLFYYAQVDSVPVSDAEIAELAAPYREYFPGASDYEILEESGMLEMISPYKFYATYEFYDMTGALLATTKSPMINMYEAEDDFEDYLEASIESLTYDEDEKAGVVRIGDKLFELKDGVCKNIVACEGAVMHNYDAVIGNYGYYLGCPSADMSTTFAIQVYNVETGELVLTHDVFPEADDFMSMMMAMTSEVKAFVLENGDILVNFVSEVGGIEELMPFMNPNEAADFDFSYYDEEEHRHIRYNYDCYVLDVETGEKKTVDLGNNLIVGLMSATELKEMYDDVYPYTDKVVNAAHILTIENQSIVAENFAFLDNDLNVLYTLDFKDLAYEIDFEHYADEPLEYLSTGDILIKLVETAPTDYAIVTPAGKLRCYVPDGAEVLDGVINVSGVLYNYDLEKAFEENVDTHLLFQVGSNLYVRKFTEDAEGNRNSSYQLLKFNGTAYVPVAVESDFYGNYNPEDMDLVSVPGCVIITDKNDTDELGDEVYTLYNCELKKLIVSEAPITVVNSDGDSLILEAVNNGKTVKYALK